jgi:hypothetical protein
MGERNTVKSDCRASWVGKGMITYCPTHDYHFNILKGQKCKYYESDRKSVESDVSFSMPRKINHPPLRNALNHTDIRNSDTDSELSKIRDVRSHAFTFVLSVKNPLNWDNRKLLLDSKGIQSHFKKTGFGKGVLTALIDNYKVWLSAKSVTVYFPDWRSYFSHSAVKGYNYAISDFMAVIRKIEVLLGSDLTIDGSYKFRVSKQHHALVHNSLAKMYNREGRKLEVRDAKGEVWLLIDNSEVGGLRLDELETVHSKTAVSDNVLVKRFFNETKETGLMPKDILEMERANQELFKNVIQEQGIIRQDIDKRLVWMDKNFQSHQRILEKMERRLDSLMTKPKALRQTKRDKVQRLLRRFGW